MTDISILLQILTPIAMVLQAWLFLKVRAEIAENNLKLMEKLDSYQKKADCERLMDKTDMDIRGLTKLRWHAAPPHPPTDAR